MRHMGRYEGIRPRQPIALLITVCCTAVLLPTLAVLQYRWIGEVSRAARDRMHTALDHDLFGFRRDFDEQIRRVSLRNTPGLRGGPGRTAEIAPHDQVKRWATGVTNPAVVRDAFLVKRDAGKISMEQFDLVNGTFQAMAVPDSLAKLVGNSKSAGAAFDANIPARVMMLPMETSFGRSGPGGFRFGGPRGGEQQGRFGRGGPFRGGPERGGPERGGRPDFSRGGPPPFEGSRRPPPNDARPPFDFRQRFIERPQAAYSLLVVYDLNYFQKKLLPDLVQEYFGNGSEYLVRIEGPKGTIYQNAKFDGADARERLFHLSFAGGSGGGGPEQPPGEDGIWEIVVRHRAGSLDAAVATAQRRDVAASVAIFCVLGISIAVLVLLTRRTSQLARMQMEFVAGVSHELRTPLTVVNSAADNLAAGIVQPESVKRYGELIRRETRRLARMVEDVLAFSGIEHSHRPRHPQPVDLGGLVDQAMAGCALELQQSGCVVEKDIEQGMPPVVGDPAWLEQCLRNLIGNAAKYAASGKWIGIRLRREEGFAAIRVEDRGPGVEAADLKKLFAPFYRARSAVEAQTEGSGIGLSVVKRIVEAHRGTVDLKSEPGKGCIFTVRLPLELA